MKLRSGTTKVTTKTLEKPKAQNESANLETINPPILKPSTPVVNNKTVQDKFNEIYEDLKQPGSFSAKLKLYFRRNETHSLHKNRRKKFPRRKIITKYPGHILQTDLIDMQKFSGSNSGFNFILVVIDCFSKKIWLEALKNKSGLETAKNLRKIFERIGYPIQTLIFDRGLEYLNKYVDSLLKEYRIHSYHINGPHKASSAERANRTIKQFIWKYFTSSRRKRWVDIIYNIADNYNKTFHSAIKMAPNDVTWSNRKKVFKALFPKLSLRIKCRLKVGDRVRILLKKDIFDKSYTVNWSRDIFTIIKIFQKNGVCWYRLKDIEGKIYPRSKYYYELNQV